MLYWLLRTFLAPIMRIVFRMRVEGRRNVPRRGPVIIAANHTSFLDSFFLPMNIGWRKMTFVAKAEYFESKKTAWFFRGAGQIPIKRDGGTASEGALAAAREVLEGGGVFGIYPEGTRSRDGRLYKGHTGVARLAMQTGAVIVPAALIGAREIQPPDTKIPKLFRPVTIRFGTPIDVTAVAGSLDDGLALRRITDAVMWEIQRMSGQEYVPTYATKKPDDVPATAARVKSLDEIVAERSRAESDARRSA